MKYNTFTLPNGLRIIHLPSASPVVYCGYGVAAGSRDEKAGEEGLAHFCEHVSFKGTGRRSSRDIINDIEGVGGDLNAFTNKEDTFFYAAVLKEHTARAVDVLSDMMFHSAFPTDELEKEKTVICEEIDSYNDSPAELIFDEFENIVFKGHPLGHNILGSEDNVKRFSSEDAARFTSHYYRPDNMIFFAYGDIDFEELVSMVENETEGFADASPVAEKDTDTNIMTALSTGQTIHSSRDTHQTHILTGTQAYGIHDFRRMPLYVLNNILGGPAMNARLNLKLREQYGLVYTVESSMVSYGDTGLWCTYLGCDKENAGKCLELIRKELDKCMKKPLGEKALSAAKKQLKGQIGIACDNRENFALDFGKSFLHYGREKDLDRLFADIDAVKPKQIQQVAHQLFDKDRLTTLIYD